MTFILTLLGIALFLMLLLWSTRGLMKDGKTGRCPTCGVDRSKYPHKPRCNYWRDQ